MTVFENGAVSIHYDDERTAGSQAGSDFPVLLIAPGGMRSANDLWNGMPWNPRTALSDAYRLIGMDQRNAGRSSAPVSGSHGWATYTGDQLGLLDHLGVERCHVIGMCIGGPYIMGLIVEAPERFASAVLLQPVGVDDSNRGAFYEKFDEWAADVRATRPDVSDDEWRSFRSNMWDGEFVMTATPDQVAACQTPMLVAMGNDLFHPQSTSRRIAELAPDVTFVESWKEGDALVAVDGTIKQFLAAHTS